MMCSEVSPSQEGKAAMGKGPAGFLHPNAHSVEPHLCRQCQQLGALSSCLGFGSSGNSLGQELFNSVIQPVQKNCTAVSHLMSHSI